MNTAHATRYAVLLLLLLFAAPSGSADTIHVPGDFATIQEAIQAAVDGDLVLVAPGTYPENINFLGKAVTVSGGLGPEVTVIDGGQAGSAVVFNSNETLDSILEGFTVANGVSVDGGGICCNGASPLIRHNIIRDNAASMSGGGIFCIYSEARIDRNVVHGNIAGWSGGGINTSKYATTVTNNIVFKNSAGKRGGGVRFAAVSFELANNTLFENFGRYGGGIASSGAPSIIRNNAVHHNTAMVDGGGLHCSSSTVEAMNNTFFGNMATAGGGGICLGYDVVMYARNTILWNNAAPAGPELWIGSRNLPSSMDIDYSDVEGGQAQVHVEPGCTLVLGSSMMDDDPLLVDPASGDLHLTYPSPCREAGDHNAKGLPATDFEGDPRVAYAAVDLGADEFHRHLYWKCEKNSPGEIVSLHFVGLPGTAPVGLFIGSGVLDPPLPSMWGEWYLQFPFTGPIVLAPIPGNGVEILTGTIPPAPPGPYSIPMQGLIGNTLTNLSVLPVQ